MDEFDRHYLEKVVIEASIRMRKNQLEGVVETKEGNVMRTISREEERKAILAWEKAVDALMEAEKNEKVSQGRQS